MNYLKQMFASPDLYPVSLDFEQNKMGFVRMTRSAYREATFLGPQAARRLGTDYCEFRLDDILFAAKSDRATQKPVSYILHTAYCSSTLLARYFELIPSCFVLKEPQLLTEVAMRSRQSLSHWQDVFELAVRLLTRTYEPDQTTVIKTNVPCNLMGNSLLEENNSATVTFLMTPIREFILAALKLEARRIRVRYWNKAVFSSGRVYPQMANVDPGFLRDPEAAAYWWLATHFQCQEMSCGPHRSRVAIVNGTLLATCPQNALPVAVNLFGLKLDAHDILALTKHPDINKHSKDLSQIYDSNQRERDIRKQEVRFGLEADLALEWVAAQGIRFAELTPL